MLFARLWSFLYFQNFLAFLLLHYTVDTGGGVLIFLDVELRVQAKNMDNLK